MCGFQPPTKEKFVDLQQVAAMVIQASIAKHTLCSNLTSNNTCSCIAPTENGQHDVLDHAGPIEVKKQPRSTLQDACRKVHWRLVAMGIHVETRAFQIVISTLESLSKVVPTFTVIERVVSVLSCLISSYGHEVGHSPPPLHFFPSIRTQSIFAQFCHPSSHGRLSTRSPPSSTTNSPWSRQSCHLPYAMALPNLYKKRPLR